MSYPNQIWTPEDLDTVGVATALLRSAKTLIGEVDGLARALLDDVVVLLGRATGAFAEPFHVRH